MVDAVVLDASAMVDLLLASELADAIALRLRDQAIHVPAHFDAEVLSALRRLSRARRLPEDAVPGLLDSVAASGFERHPVAPLMAGAWRRRSNVRLVDALYVELAEGLGAPVLSTDRALAAASSIVELIHGES